MKYVVILFLIALLVLHQDYWQWNDATLVLGVLPWTLAYHLGLSVAAAGVWWLTTLFCWPKEPDDSFDRTANRTIE
jgi:hypothetical protein